MEDNKKKNNGSVIIITILAVLVVGLAGYIGYDKLLNKESVKTNKTEEKTKNEDNNKKTTEETKSVEETKNVEETKTIENTNTTNEISNKAKCYGTYYVNGNATEGIYILKEDGNFEVKNTEKAGVFIINENTITFIKRKHTTGPRNEDPVYEDPQSYLIYEDCSKIRLTESGSHTSAWLEKAN